MVELVKKQLIDMLTNYEDKTLYDQAHSVSLSNVGNFVHLRALIEPSNHCRRQCSYCGLNCTNRNLLRYRMDYNELLDLAYEACDAGYKTLVIQTGEDPSYTKGLLPIVEQIAKTGMVITLGLGELSYQSYLDFYNAGAKRYLLKHETSDPKLYRKLHPDSNLETRIKHIKQIKAIGYETGSGFMVGLPHQTIESIADDILLLKELQCDMAGIGTFIPHHATPLADTSHGSIILTKRAIALTRLVLPKANLPATTSLNLLNGTIDDTLNSGANVIMEKITPLSFRKLYEIYPNSSKIEVEGYSIIHRRKIIEDNIRLLGKEPV